MSASTRVKGRSWEWWPGVGDLRLMGTRETSHRAEPHRCSHRLLSDASPSCQQAEREVNSPKFDAEVRTPLSIPEPRPVGRSLRGMLILTPPRRQYFAGRVSAGRAGIRDEPLYFLERLNPSHLLHRAIAPWTADRILWCGIRHNKPQLSTSTIKPVNVRTFPLYRQKVLIRFFAAMPIRSYLDGHRFDPETIRSDGHRFRNVTCGAGAHGCDSQPNPRRGRPKDYRTCTSWRV